MVVVVAVVSVVVTTVFVSLVSVEISVESYLSSRYFFFVHFLYPIFT
mgnify:CR=1 FL=1